MGGEFFFVALGIFFVIIVLKGIRVVPQQQAYIIERLGRYRKTLHGGLHLIIPFFDRVAYKHSLKEEAMDVQSQSAITRDNVTLNLDGVIYMKVLDPKNASYGVENPYYALTQLAQTTMRSEIGKLSMDATFEERENLNHRIVHAINQASNAWGIECLRYEIKDITPPASVLKAMEQQVTAERHKRAEILESEGKRQATINVAEGAKQEIVLASEAAMHDQVNRAKGEAEAIERVAEATAKGVEVVAASIQTKGGSDAVGYRIAEQYVAAFEKLAKENNTVLLPANPGDASSMVAQALAVFDNVKQKSSSAK